MTFDTAWRDKYGQNDHPYFLSISGAQKRFAATALVCVALACCFMLWSYLHRGKNDLAADVEPAVAIRGDNIKASVAAAYARLSQALNLSRRRAAAVKAYAALFDARNIGFSPGTFVRSAPLLVTSEPAVTAQNQPAIKTMSASAPDNNQIVRSSARAVVPLTAAQARLASIRNGAHPAGTAASVPAREPGIFERLFGKIAPFALAYATPEDGSLGGAQSLASNDYDHFTAVYDISAHIVYLPDGTMLEAHSGFGPWLDDPHHTEIRMRGATPAALYDLQLREGLFHGVRALRLIPEDEAKVFGRTGLLAHTFMLGPNGQSNGCVSFRDYDAFLKAYLRGEIKRLAVVAQL